MREIGEHTYIAIFSPIDGSESEEIKIKVNVEKKDISNTIAATTTTFIYTGYEITPNVKGIGVDDEDVEVKLTSEKGTNVGKYNYIYEIVSDYYIGNKTIEITINKAEAKIEGTVNTISYSKDLKVPEWKYTITGLVGNDSADNLLGLDIKVTKPEINGVNTYTYSVEATSTNYIFEITNNTLEVTQGTYSRDYEITNPNVSSATVEDKLGDLTINDTDQGTFSWLNNEEVINSAGSNSYKATFTPKDSNYKSEEVTITFNVNTKDISDYINVDESSLKAIYDGNEHNIEVTISYKENSYNYLLSEYDKVNAGNKEITITINDDNYSGSKVVTLVIEKATIQFTKPNIDDLPYNTNISSIELGDVEGGRFVLISEGIIEVGENNIKIKFIPNDTTNYKEEEFEIIVIGLRLESVITNEEIPTLTYNGQNQDISNYFSVNNSEQQITLSYKLNGEVVDSIKNAGTYEVTASVSESEHYKASSIIINVKLEVEVPEIVLTAYYGDGIINIETPTSEYGIWSWDNSELGLKTIGENDYVAVFTSTDGETIVKAKITIKVEKKDISNTIEATTTTFTYTGNEIMPTVKGIGVDDEDVEVKLTSEKGTNVGKYNYIYEIVSDYYIGNKTIEITINKAEAKIEGTVNTISYSKDLKVPEWKYTITGLVGNDSADNLLGLDIKVTKPEINGVNTYTYSVEATSTNYIFEITNNTLEVTQGTYSRDYEITNPNVSSATVEDKLGDLTINDTDQGTFSWLNNEEVINSAGSNSYKATFTPKDSNYKSEEVTITFNVNTKDISDYINVDESSLKTTYDGNEHDIEVTISYKENSYNYSLSEYDKVNAGDKEITITINDDNYSGNKVVTLVINKKTAILAANSQTMNFGENVPDLKYVVNNLAPNDSEDVLGIVVTKPTVTDVITYQYVINYNKNGNYELEITGDLSLIVNKGNYDIDSILKPTVGVITIGMDYANISITQKDDRGIFSITNNGIIGKNNVLNLHFEPKDNRYNSFDTTMTFTFKKVDISDQIIVPDERTFTYTGEPITFEASIDSSYGVTLKYSDNVQTNIGNYETSITIVENDYYEGSTFTNWSIVAPNYDDLDKPEFENVEYLDYLRDLVFDANADYRGTYSITNPNIQIDVVGEYEITLTFTPHDTNVAPKEVKVTIQVNKKDISENINVVINETLIYNGQEQTPTANVTISGYEQYNISPTFEPTSGTNAGQHDYVVNIIDNDFFTGSKTGKYNINKAQVKIAINCDDVTYLPDLVIDSDHFKYSLVNGQFYGNDSSGLVFKVDNDAIINGGYGKYPVTVEFANENYDLSYDPFNLIVNRKYDYDEINISKAMQDSEESIYTPIYGPNNMILGIMLNGTYNTEFKANDLKVTLTTNTGAISALTRVDQNINGYYITLNLTGFSTTTEVTLTLALKEAPKEVYSNLKIKVMNGVTNITTINETKAWAINTNSVLNNDLVYNPKNDTNGYSFVDNRLVYTSKYIEGAQNASNGVIVVSGNSTLYGNGYKIDGSLLAVANSNTSKKFIQLSNGNLDNMELKLGIASTYDREANFNIGSAVIETSGNNVINNTYINGGLRGIRILSNLTLNNVRFKNNVVANEIYSDGNATQFDVYFNNVIIDGIVDKNGQDVISYTLGILFFPGGGGDGMANFHYKKLHFNNFKYLGWVDSASAVELVNRLVQGLGSLAASLGKFSEKDIKQCFATDTIVKINGKEYVNLALVVPTEIAVTSAKLSSDWDDSTNLEGFNGYIVKEAKKTLASFIPITIAKVKIYLNNINDSSFDYSEHFKMSGSTPIGVIELSDFIFHY